MPPPCPLNRRPWWPLLLLTVGRLAAAQAARDPRVAQPERPTVATHAFTVPPGYLEVELGGEWDRYRSREQGQQYPIFVKVGLSPTVQLGVLLPVLRPPGSASGLGDATLFGKVHLTEAGTHPVLADFALVAGVKLASGSGSRSSGTTDASILLVSSRQLGAVGLDLNAGYVRRSGNGTSAPKNATVFTAAVAGALYQQAGWTVELYAYPRTQGPSGATTVAALLGGPTLRLNPATVFDVGRIVRLAGDQPSAWYVGLTRNLGSLRR